MSDKQITLNQTELNKAVGKLEKGEGLEASERAQILLFIHSMQNTVQSLQNELVVVNRQNEGLNERLVRGKDQTLALNAKIDNLELFVEAQAEVYGFDATGAFETWLENHPKG